MSGRTWELTGADGQTITIPEGEWYINTKARPRRMMQNSLSSDARRVYACLELATMGFQQELAVTMTKGVIRPLAPSDICDQTGISKQNVRRGLAELEREGLAQRRSSDGGPLQNGKIEILCWAVPRKAETKKGSHARLPFPSWVPDSWKPLIPLLSHSKIRLPTEIPGETGADRDYLLARGAELAADYQNLEKVVRELIKGSRADERIYKEETNGNQLGKEGTAAAAEKATSSSGEPVNGSAAAAAPPPVIPDPPTTPETTAVAVIPKDSQEAEEVRAVLAQYGTTDPPTARRMIDECRKIAPNCTALEICHFIRRKGDELVRRPSVKNPIGLLLKVVPHDFEGDFRQRLQEPPPRQAMSAADRKLQDEVDRIKQVAAMAKWWSSKV